MTKFGILVVSDAIYYGRSKDVSGERAKEFLEEHGYIVVDKIIVPNNYTMIHRGLLELLNKVDVIIAIGGTGPSPRDITVDVIESLAWRTIPGFGEIFRLISYEREGIHAITSRAGMYLIGDKVVVAIPGSPSAIEIAIREIIVKIIDHIIEEVRRYSGPHRKPTPQ